MIAALGHNRVLGKDNQLLWHIPDDLKRFKALTLGHPVIMGRKTFESIVAALGKALPGRSNIVVTHDESWSYSDVLVAHSIEDAITKAKELNSEEIFIGGGAQIYNEALPFADRLYLTLIDDDKEGDSFFPEYKGEFIKVISNEPRDWEGLKYQWVDIDRA